MTKSDLRNKFLTKHAAQINNWKEELFKMAEIAIEEGETNIRGCAPMGEEGIVKAACWSLQLDFAVERYESNDVCFRVSGWI